MLVESGVFNDSAVLHTVSRSTLNLHDRTHSFRSVGCVALPLDLSVSAVLEKVEGVVVHAVRPDFKQQLSLARQLAWRVIDVHAVCRLEFDLAWLEPVCQAIRQVRLLSKFCRPAEPGKRSLDRCEDRPHEVPIFCLRHRLWAVRYMNVAHRCRAFERATLSRYALGPSFWSTGQDMTWPEKVYIDYRPGSHARIRLDVMVILGCLMMPTFVCSSRRTYFVKTGRMGAP